MAKAKTNAALPLEDKAPKFVVVSPFRDRSDFTLEYNPGDEVGHLERERLEKLIALGLVQAQ